MLRLRRSVVARYYNEWGVANRAEQASNVSPIVR